MDLFKIEPGLFLWTWITFGILLVVLSKWVYPPLLAGIKQREKKIADSVDKAEEIEKRLAAIEEEQKAVMAETDKRADALLRQVRSDADVLKKQLAAKAEEQSAEILKEARRKIEDERQAILDSLRDELAEFVLDASGKLVEHSFSDKNEKKWVRQLVDKL